MSAHGGEVVILELRRRGGVFRSRLSRAFLAAAVAVFALTAAHGAWAGSPTIGLGALTQVQDILSGDGSCTYPAASRVFLPWFDLASYSPAPQGDLADTSDWQLAGTSLSSDHDPWTAGSASLVLPAGSRATTPEMCVGLVNPTIRFFVNNGAGRASDLKVSLVYQSVLGGTTTVTLAKLRTSGPGWQPSAPVLVGANLMSAITAGGYATVSFVFTPEGGPWSIDGVYVDPFLKG
jgi:hypothetical protein